MKITILLILIFINQLLAQEIQQNSITHEAYGPIRKQARAVPRFFICGAEMNVHSTIRQNPQKCQKICRTKRRNVWSAFKRYTHCDTKCTPVPPTEEWTRSNGIKFRFCHFQKWGNQLTLQQHGSFPWLGMKMCPFNQYVYGFQMKLDGRDGLSGLNLKCKNIYNSNENSIVNVKDNGRGMWFPGKTSSYFAVGFAIQNIGFVGFVPGLRMQFAMPPVIAGVQFNYMVPPNFNSVPEVIDTVVVVNNGKVGMNKIIQFNKERQYQRIWQNSQSQLTGITLSKLFSQSYSVKSTLSIPILSSSNTNTQKSQIQIVNKTETIKSFSFGTIERVKIGQKQRDEILVQACTKKTIKQIVYTGQADIPYIVSIQYTNGVRIQTDTINGYYRGVVTGSVETVINQQTIC